MDRRALPKSTANALAALCSETEWKLDSIDDQALKAIGKLSQEQLTKLTKELRATNANLIRNPSAYISAKIRDLNGNRLSPTYMKSPKAKTPTVGNQASNGDYYPISREYESRTKDEPTTNGSPLCPPPSHDRMILHAGVSYCPKVSSSEVVVNICQSITEQEMRRLRDNRGMELFIGNLPRTADFSEVVHHVLDKTDGVAQVRYPVVNSSGKGYAFVVYERRTCAQRGRHVLDHSMITHLKTRIYVTESAKTSLLLVGNIPEERSAAQLLSDFKMSCPHLRDVYIWDNNGTGNSGFCFLRFDDPKNIPSALRSFQHSNSVPFGGLVLIDWAKPDETGSCSFNEKCTLSIYYFPPALEVETIMRWMPLFGATMPVEVCLVDGSTYVLTFSRPADAEAVMQCCIDPATCKDRMNAYLDKTHSGDDNGFQSKPSMTKEIGMKNESEETADIVRYGHISPNTSLREGSIVNATISCIRSPTDFCIIPLDKSADDYQIFYKEMQSLYNSTDAKRYSLRSPCRAGQLCVARFEEDNMWHRAEILQKMYSGRVNVVCVDNGRTSFLTEDRIMHLQQKFFNMPAQALHCRLAHVRPVQGEWSAQAVESFDSFCRRYPMYITRCDRISDTIHYVALFAQDVHIGKTLCGQGLAVQCDTGDENISIEEFNAKLAAKKHLPSAPKEEIDPTELSTLVDAASISSSSASSTMPDNWSQEAAWDESSVPHLSDLPPLAPWEDIPKPTELSPVDSPVTNCTLPMSAHLAFEGCNPIFGPQESLTLFELDYNNMVPSNNVSVLERNNRLQQLHLLDDDLPPQLRQADLAVSPPVINSNFRMGITPAINSIPSAYLRPIPTIVIHRSACSTMYEFYYLGMQMRMTVFRIALTAYIWSKEASQFLWNDDVIETFAHRFPVDLNAITFDRHSSPAIFEELRVLYPLEFYYRPHGLGRTTVTLLPLTRVRALYEHLQPGNVSLLNLFDELML